MLQYKVLEMGLNSEIGNIQMAQTELEKIKSGYNEVEQHVQEQQNQISETMASIATAVTINDH